VAGAAALLPLLLAAPALAGEWTRYRGPNGTGAGEGDSVPTRWEEGEVNWRVKLPGQGHSGPVLWGEKVFLTSAEGEGRERLVLCLRAEDGGTEWIHRSPSRTHRKHQRNSYASSTPAVDAERLYAAFSTPSSYTLQALDHAGKEVWSADLGPFESQHGDGTSPILFEDLVVLANEQDGASFVIALDRRSGATRWKTPRRTAEAAYGTPCLYQEGGRPALLLSSHAHGLYSLDARTGKPLWEARVFDKRTVSSPIVTCGLAMGTCGSGGGGSFLVAVRTGGEGEEAAERVAYKLTRAIPYVPTPVAGGGFGLPLGR
jgi:outer membrane protein assembly factor BamB